MLRTSNLNIKIDSKTKTEVEQLFSQFGITVTDAITIFLKQSLEVGGLPFEVKQPEYNAETEEALEEARGIASGKIAAKSYFSAKELFKDIDAGNSC